MRFSCLFTGFQAADFNITRLNIWQSAMREAMGLESSSVGSPVLVIWHSVLIVACFFSSDKTIDYLEMPISSRNHLYPEAPTFQIFRGFP